MKMTVNAAQVRQLENKLRTLNKRGVLFAEVEAVNRAAFETMKDARHELGSKMVLRNNWTRRSIQVRKATMRTAAAAVGSTQAYMATQELGGREVSSGKHGLPIPTSVASGEGRNAKPRQRLVRRPNKIANITLDRRNVTRRNTAKHRSQRNAHAVRRAATTSKKYVFLELQKTTGIFRVYGGKRKPRVELVQDLTRKAVDVPRNPWLKPVADRHASQMPRYYADALRRQLRRLGR